MNMNKPHTNNYSLALHTNTHTYCIQACTHKMRSASPKCAVFSLGVRAAENRWSCQDSCQLQVDMHIFEPRMNTQSEDQSLIHTHLSNYSLKHKSIFMLHQSIFIIAPKTHTIISCLYIHTRWEQEEDVFLAPHRDCIILNGSRQIQ